jgi:integrase/recombinase XerD
VRFEREADEYLKDLASRGLAAETVRWRRSPLRIFFAYLEAKNIQSLQEIHRGLVEEYLHYLKTEHRTRQGRPIAEGTYQDHFITLKDFFLWLEKMGKILRSPMVERPAERNRKHRRLPQVLTPQEAVRVLESVPPTTALELRNRAILELLYSTGIRKRELARLNVADFSFENRELLIVDGKREKDRFVPVGEYACRFTEAYIRLVRPWQVHGDEEKALFVTQNAGLRLSLRTVGGIVEQAAEKSGIDKRVTPHAFRHSMATHMLRNRADLRHIQAILGHASIVSTEIYTHMRLEDLKEVVRRAHPHGKRKTKPPGSTTRKRRAFGSAE